MRFAHWFALAAVGRSRLPQSRRVADRAGVKALSLGVVAPPRFRAVGDATQLGSSTGGSLRSLTGASTKARATATSRSAPHRALDLLALAGFQSVQVADVPRCLAALKLLAGARRLQPVMRGSARAQDLDDQAALLTARIERETPKPMAPPPERSAAS